MAQLSDTYKYDPTDTMNAVGSFGAASRKRWQDLAGLQKQEGADYLSNYRNFVNSQEALPVMQERIGKELGLPTLQKNAFELQRMLARTPETQRRATLGFDVNQNQMDRLISSKVAKLAPIASEATAQSQQAQDAANTLMGINLAEQQRLEKPYTVEREMLSERQAREFTGFGQVEQRELDGLMAKLNAGVTLTSAEMGRMTQLAAQENEYRMQKERLAQQESEFSRSLGWEKEKFGQMNKWF